MRPHISIRGLVRPLVSPLVGLSVTLLSNSVKNGFLQREEEEGWTRKDGRGGRCNVEKEAMRRVKK